MRPAFRILLFAAALPAAAQDYEREKRWEAEIVPAIVVGEPMKLTAGGRQFLAIHTAAARPRGVVVLAHGRNVHPDHDVIGSLRMALADRGYDTLSIQMPVLGPDANRPEMYREKLFPEAKLRLAAAAEWAASRGRGPPALLSHSMGSWMANEYFDENPGSPYRAWVCLGLTGGFSWATYRSPRPILDVSGAADLEPVVEAQWRRRMTLAFAAPGSKQVVMPDADHFYAGRHNELARLVAQWLDAALAPR